MSEEEIFHQARARTDPDERAAYVEQACGGNAALRASVEALLRADVGATGFMDRTAPDVDATLDVPIGERPDTVIGPYKLIEQIGEGGMGTVWMAQQTEPVKRLVAVKLIKAGMDSKQVIARFEAERQALALMDHPSIAKVLDGGTTVNGRPYFVMDLVKGVPITQYCDAHHLTPRQRLELFVPVCQAVQHAHQKGIIHRDIKPSNVLIALYDGRPVPKVIDFGVAKAAGPPLTDKTLVTGFGAIVGTLEYMSPEQAEINQLDVDTRSDVYSLGVLLYELLVGSPPFTKKDLGKAGVLEMLRVIREQEPSRPSMKLSTAEGLPTLATNRGTEPAKLTRLVRGELDWIVMKALEKDRSRRYETANGFAMDVQRYLADEAVQACPPSARYRLSKFGRKYQKALAIAAAFAVILVVGLVASTLLAVWARSAEREATRQRITAEAAKQEAVAQADQAEKNFAEAQRQRAQAVAHLYRSLAGEARSIREARGSGYRALAWKRLEQALRLETPEKDLTALRREAGACLGDFVGLEPTDWEAPARTRFNACDLHPDGELLAIVLMSWTMSGQSKSEVLLRNVVTGQEIGRLRPERGVFFCAKFSADGKRLFTGELNGVVGVWQADAAGNWHRAKALPVAPQSSGFVTPFPLFPSFFTPQPPIAELAVSQDASLLAALSRSQFGGAISLWNLGNGKLEAPFHAADAPSNWASMLRIIAFSPRGDLMAAGLAGESLGAVLVWDVVTRELRRTLRPGFGEVYHVGFSADAKYLACACREGLVLFDTADFERHLFARAGGPWGQSWMCAFSPDSRLLAIPAPEAGALRLWNITTNHEVTVPIARDNRGAPFVSFSHDGKRLVSLGYRSVRMWNLAGALEKQALSGHSGGISALAFSPDGKLLVSAGKDHIVRFWDPVTGSVIRELRGFAAPPQSVNFDPSGHFLATTEYTPPGAVKLWDARSGEQLSTVPGSAGPGYNAADFSRDGKHLVVCGESGVKLWSVVDVAKAEDGRPQWSFKEAAHPARNITYSVCFSPDAQFFAWTDGWRVTVCERATGQMHSWPAHTFGLLSLSYLPDGKRFVLVNIDTGMIEVRDATGGEVKVTFGRKELVHGISIHTALSPDGNWLAVGGDKAVTVWDLNKRELLFALPEERGTIWSMAWSPDKNLLAVGSSHGGLAIWNLPRIKSELSRIGLGW